jgi:glycosyltransferase involved in cell wall biosynthesis
MNLDISSAITSRIFPTSQLIRQRLETIRELNPRAHSTLLSRIEFQLFRRQKLRMRRLVRKYILRRPDTRGSMLNRRDFIRSVNDAENEKVILFVARHPTHDFLKASDYLRRQGTYKTAILMFHPTLRPVMEEHFDAVWVYPSFYDLCAVLIKLHPWLIHAQGSSSFYPFPVLAKSMTDAPVISQVMDVPSNAKPTQKHYADRGGSTEYALDDFMQTYPYDHTDGVTIFNYQMSITDRLISGIAVPSPIIEFHNYPSTTESIPPKTRQLKNEGIHIVYAGAVEPSTLPREHYADLQFHNLIRKITSQGLHFHLYPSPQYEASSLRRYLHEYIEIERVNSLFHYHDPVPPGQTAAELSQYHYGSLLYMLEDIDEFDFVRMYEEAGGIGSKFFTYLEAGLPMIVSSHSTAPARIVQRYKNGIVIEESQLNQLSDNLASQDYEQMNSGVTQAQKSLSLENHAVRLQELYEKIGNSH